MQPKIRVESNTSKYIPFERSKITDDAGAIGEILGITEAKSIAKEGIVVSYQFDGDFIAGADVNSLAFKLGYRAAGPASVPGFRWLDWITGYIGGFTAGNTLGFRSIALGQGITPGHPQWTNFSWDAWGERTSIAAWYKWGARKFHLHLPFGKVSARRGNRIDGQGNRLPNAVIGLGNQEAGAYQPDSYSCTKYGFTCPITKIFGNVPMPWLTDDIVDGTTSGFVPLFRALTTGETGDLDPEMFKRLTGIGGASAWFDPNDPMEITAYNGGVNGETFRRWRRWFDAGSGFVPNGTVIIVETDPEAQNPVNTGGPSETDGMRGASYARSRLEESFGVYKRAGMRLGIDALVVCPGPTLGENWLEGEMPLVETADSVYGKSNLGGVDTFLYQPISYHTHGSCGYGGSDRGWWSFFSEYVIPTFGKQNIFMEAIPSSIRRPPALGGGWVANPYVVIGGIQVCTADEGGRAAFQSQPYDAPNTYSKLRHHYLSELGKVEFRRNPNWAPVAPHIGWIDANGITHLNGHYWYLEKFAEKSELRFCPGCGAYASNLAPQISGIGFDQGERFLRAKSGWAPGYPGSCIYGDAFIADHLLRYQHHAQLGSTIGNDNSGIMNDKTIPQVMVGADTLMRIPDGVIGQLYAANDPLNPVPGTPINLPVLSKDQPNGFTLIGGVKFTSMTGVTLDFNRRYPTINEFARYLANFAAPNKRLDPFGITFEAPLYGSNMGSVLSEEARRAAIRSRVEGIKGVMWLDPYEYDGFASTALRGICGGFYVPNTEVDIPKIRLFNYLDVKIRSWYRTFGEYPKYIGWNLTEHSSLVDNQLGQFELERYLHYPKDIPLNYGESPNNFAIRYTDYYSKTPGITWDSSTESERFLNAGHASPTVLNPGAGSSLYINAKNIVIDLLQKTKEWRDARGLTGWTRVGLYKFPFIPKDASTAYKIVGNKAAAVIEIAATGGWGDRVLPRQSINNTGAVRVGFDRWSTEEEASNTKKCIKLEYRKRYEPFLKECEVVFPEIYCRVSTDLTTDQTQYSLMDWQREILELAWDLKTISNWDVLGVSPDSPPALKDAEIIPIVTPVLATSDYFGATAANSQLGDPLTIQRGSLFDYEKMNYTMIDWMRDEYLRPINGVGKKKKIDGLSVRRGFISRGIDAMKSDISTYPGRTADREWVLKWLKADQGAGATIDWSDPSDVQTKMKSFFDVSSKVSKNLLYRFDKGQPRLDIEKPFSHVPFAAGWSPGYDGIYPNIMDGVTIEDVMPLLWVGWVKGTNGNLRDPGNTAPISGVSFATFMNFYRKVPKGKRVLLPYYWHQDPISDQILQYDYYKGTTDGSTYSGSLPTRSHETPGAVRLGTPWAYVQTDDAKKSFESFLNQCAATGAVFDFIADDGESWIAPIVGSNTQTFTFPFGPTGMPAAFTANNGNLFVTQYPSWLISPDPRWIRTNLFDTRFSTEKNSFNGMTLGGAITKYYRQILEVPQIRDNIGLMIQTPNASDVSGSTAGEIMQYYYLESGSGISATTGPTNSISAYAPPFVDAAKWISGNESTILSTSPFRDPWSSRIFTTLGGKQTSRYVAWLAHYLAVENIVMGDLYKKLWIDTLDGFTFDQFRKMQYSHYDIFPLGVTEGTFTRDSSGHPIMKESYPHINPAPTLYGELGSEMIDGKYYRFPNDDFERFSIVRASDIHGGVDAYNKAGVFKFTSNDVAGRSYIAMLSDLMRVRGLLRNSPNSWKYLNPWIWSPSTNGVSSYAAFKDTEADITQRTDIRYWKELLYHCLLSGTYYFNYFNPDTDNIDASPGGSTAPFGFTFGAVLMQGVLNEWKAQSEGRRVQPASNLSGDVNKIVDRIDISDAGGNHSGATGIVISGGRIIEYSRGRTASSQFGAVYNDKYLWRITAAPQADMLYLNLDPTRFISDLPKAIDLVSGNPTFVWAKTSGNTSGTFHIAKQTAGGTALKGNHPSFPNHLVITLDSGLSGSANSGIDLRHAKTATPDSFLDQPYLIGSGRPLSFTAKVMASGNPGASGSYFTGLTGSAMTLSAVGFYDLREAFGRQSYNGNILGMETSVCFFTIGGSLWGTLVTFKDQVANRYRVSSKLLFNQNEDGSFKYGTFQPLKLKIDIDENGKWAKFYIDDVLVDTIDADTPFNDGLTAGAFDGIKSGLPVGSRKGIGVWAGCTIRDVSLNTEGGTGSDTNGIPSALIIDSTSGSPMNLSVLPGSKDGEKDVDISVSRRGVWIKRTKTSEMPLYKMSPNIDLALAEGVLPIGSGFPVDPDSVFTSDPPQNNENSNLNDVSDLRVISAWKDDPIPFDPTPSGVTVTVVAYHPSGIKRVEASPNGGMTVSRTGQVGVAYQEFEFYVPPISGAVAPQQNLPKTVAGATYRHLHEVRAKVFPFTGGTRILGGEPDAVSRYYASSVDPIFTPKKRDVNETSFFVQNIDTTNDTGYKKVVVKGGSSTSDPYNTGWYSKNLREAILHNMNTDQALRNRFSDGRGGVSYLDIELEPITANGPGSDYYLPTINDNGNATIFDANNVGINGNFVISEPERKTVRILSKSHSTPSTLYGDSSSGAGDGNNSSTSYSGFVINNLAGNWASNIRYTTSLPNANQAYVQSGTPTLRIYRLNRTNPLEGYELGRGFLTIAPSGAATNNADWIHTLAVNPYNTVTNSARVGHVFGIGKIKIGGTAGIGGSGWSAGYAINVSKSTMPDIVATSTSNQAFSFYGVTFTSVNPSSVYHNPPIDPRSFARNGNVSYKDCTIDGITSPAHGFGFSRYVVGCTANSVRGNIFSNASFVRDCLATGCNKIDKLNPSFFGRKTGLTAGSAQGKKNNIYMNTICSGNYSECISFQKNDRLVGQEHLVDNYDLLFRGLTFFGVVGIVDRIEGYVNNVHLDGVTMPNALLFGKKYRTSLDAPGSGRNQKLYIKNSTIRTIANESEVLGNNIATVVGANRSYFDGFGFSAGNGLTAMIKPNPIVGASFGYTIRGIPWISSVFPASGSPIGHNFTITDSIGVKRFGLALDSKYIFGSCGGNGYPKEATALTFASWTPNTFETSIVPRLNWVYSITPNWSGNALTTEFAPGSHDVKLLDGNLGNGTETLFSFPVISNFYEKTTYFGVMDVNKDAMREWLMVRAGYSGADRWVVDLSSTDVAATGISGHWLTSGNSLASWMATNGTFLIAGTGASANAGTLVFGPFVDSIAANRFGSEMNNAANTGLTLTDQYGNHFKISPGSFLVSGTSVIVRGTDILYQSGADGITGTPWTASNVLDFFPRDWTNYGDVSSPSAPIRLTPNFNWEGIYRPWIPSGGGGGPPQPV